MEWITILNLLKEWVSFINPVSLLKKLRQTDRIVNLEKQIDELKIQLQANDSMKGLKFINDIYFKELTNEFFCPKCFDAEKKLIHLLNAGNPDYWRCPECNNITKKTGVRERSLYREPPKSNFGYGFGE